ncbi:MAG: lysophospholipid acyltransferase family protein [Oceanicaulis sp.]
MTNRPAAAKHGAIMVKRILQSAPVQAAIAAVLAGYVAFCRATTRWTRLGVEHVEPVWRSERGVVGCIWHGRLIMSVALWPKHAQPPTVLISRSREGDAIARYAAWFGVKAVRGSSRNEKKAKQKGGLSAFREMLRHVTEGRVMCITPDGPRGPRMRAGSGAIKLARAAGAPCVPVAWSMSHARVMNSWDRAMVPLPFGRGVIAYGEPMEIPADADAARIAELALELERRLNALTEQADALCRKEAVRPAERTPVP